MGFFPHLRDFHAYDDPFLSVTKICSKMHLVFGDLKFSLSPFKRTHIIKQAIVGSLGCRTFILTRLQLLVNVLMSLYVGQLHLYLVAPFFFVQIGKNAFYLRCTAKQN